MIWKFIDVGFHHIVSTGALDHLLFLAALAACYRPRDWRHGLTVVSAFTVGHSITLALATLNIVHFSSPIVEFLIPCTIVFAGIENLFDRQSRPHGMLRPMLAGLFGLVHGAGFASSLRELFDGPIVVPLLGFNVGIELGQALVLATLIAMYTVFDAGLRKSLDTESAALRWRTSLTSVVVASAALVMAVQRIP